jgi:hypothetical protein
MFSTMGFQLRGIHSRERRDDRRDGFHVPVIVVDKVTEAGGISDGKAETNTVLLDVWIGLTWSVWRCGYGQSGDYLPALMLWMATVWGRSAFGAGGSLGG